MLIKEENILKIFKSIYDYFNENIYDISFFDFNNVYYTDDIKNDILLFCTPKNNENLDNYATTIINNNVSANPIVLILVDSCTFIDGATRLIHELVHIYDYQMFSEKYLNGNYSNIISHKYFNTYRMISEFRAFSIAEYYAVKYQDIVFNQNYTDIFIKDFPEMFSKILKKKRTLLKCQNYSLYQLMSDLGRRYFFDKHNNITNIPDSCTYKFLPILFSKQKTYELIHHVYCPMIKCNSSQDVLSNLDNFQSLFEKYFLVL